MRILWALPSPLTYALRTSIDDFVTHSTLRSVCPLPENALVHVFMACLHAVQFGFDAPIGPTPLTSLPLLPNGATLEVSAPGMATGLGGKLWPAAAAMCRFIRDENIARRHVFELGCGCGAVGIYSAALGASSVLLTDCDDDILQLAGDNANRNSKHCGDNCLVRAHKWGTRDVVLPPQLDYVLGSDVTYNRQSLDPLCRSIRWMLDERRPRVVLAHEQRHPSALANLRECATARGLEITLFWHDGVSVPTLGDETGWDVELSRGDIVLLEVTG